MSFIVGIDGPAGTGKGTITELVAKDLNLLKIDTGAMYRAFTLFMLDNNVKIEDIDKIKELLEKVEIDIVQQNENNIKKDIVLLNGRDVTSEIRSNRVTKIVSPVSSIIEVRIKMVDLQRKMAEGKNTIMEGRDITTYVFPNADVKIYLDADVEERAKRRYKENMEKGIETTFEEVLEDMKKRDYNDMHKPMGALKVAEDAIVIDTTKLTIEEVKQKVEEIVKNKMDK